MFVEGTMEVKWLSNWREIRAYTDGKKYARLEDMMSTLRVAVEQRSLRSNPVVASVSNNSRMEPGLDDPCRRCRHKHLNKDCFKQHPELRQYRKVQDKKGKAKTACQEESSDEEEIDKSPIVASILNSNKKRLLYDTGASHHFVPNKNKFINLKKYSKLFKFDQAVGSSSLTHYGTACLSIGKKSYELHDAVYVKVMSLSEYGGYSRISVGAGNLQRLANIVPDPENKMLVLKKIGKPDIKIACLICKNDVYYIRPLNENNSPKEQNNVVAPGVARIPNPIGAQRWHERLGHVGQKILKKTVDCSVGLQSINFSDLSTCETCHLSKAQRFISRDQIITPNKPLDEIFVNTIGKLTAAVNGEQYAVIITDAKTRMRWALNTHSKDQIASLLIQWIEDQKHQYDKRVKIIFRDGGSEFMRTKSYCEQHGIRTDISAPDTPEQNGASEAANKVVLTMARSMLIDARMPSCYWPWAIKHACFIVNRLYCLRTKMVPLIDFLQGLNQPAPEKIDFSNMPRFGCRAYKYIDPKPGKFSPRAETGWFVGFQANTNKNSIIFHPHWTLIQGWKWIESFSPHVTFNEDLMFGDRLHLAAQQSASNFWSNRTSSFFDRSEEPSESSSSTSTDIQTDQQFEREHYREEVSQSIETEDDVPQVPTLPRDPSRDSEIGNNTTNEEHDQGEKFQEEQREYTLAENLEPYLQHQAETNRQTQIGQDMTELSQLQEVIQNHNDFANENEELSYDFNMTGWDPIPPIAGQKRSHSPDSNIHQGPSKNRVVAQPDHEIINEETPYDVIMTGWEPVAPKAGHKRDHSPEAETMQTKRDSKTWQEAMTSPEAKQWMRAAEEEFSSLKEKGAIKIINRTKLPKGRHPMKCKWVFKKKFLADGTVDKWKTRCTAKGFTQRFGIDYQETFAPTPRAETGRLMLIFAHQLNWHRRQGDVPTAILNPELNIDIYMEMPKGFEKKNHIILLRKGLYRLKQAAALWYDDAKATLATQGLYPTTSDVCLYTTKQKDLFVLLHVDDFQVMGPNIAKIEKLMAAHYKKYKLKMVNTDFFLGIHISQPSQNVLRLSQGQYARLLLDRHGLTDCKPAKTHLERLTEPICWRSHLQREVVLSTTEAEYLAATETCRQLQWVKSLLEELNLLEMIEGSKQTNLYVDNQSAISLIKSHDNHRQSKHIALRNFFCREQYQDGKVKVIYVQSSEQLADSLTKPKSTVLLYGSIECRDGNTSQ
uniref:TE3 n=1 Tax=Blumeria hordei TaxID=2867405 RepID=A8U3S6_BLUHO|nr:TE3 [Blumeria hordei]